MSDGAIARDVLMSARLVLEPVAHRHDVALYEASVTSREALLPWMPWAAELTPDAQRAWTAEAVVAWGEQRELHFAIVIGGVAAGVTGFHHVRRMAGGGSAEIHYWVRSDLTGRGHATEAARCMLAWVRDVVGINMVILNAGIGNVRSRAVARKLGFTRDGTLPGGMKGGMGTFPAYTHHLELHGRPRRLRPLAAPGRDRRIP